MANCAIYIKGSDEIIYFLRDCTQDGRNFKGSSGSVTGVKEHLFDAKWTEDVANPIFDEDGKQTGYDKSISDIPESLRYQGIVVSTKADVDAVTRSLIAERYPASEEAKIIRMKLSGDETGWNEYRAYVDGLVQQGRACKEKHFPKKG